MKCILTLIAIGALAQAQPPDPIQALLVEVRQLRQALERSTLIGPRIQIAVERLKMQQEAHSRVARLAEDARRELDHTQSTLASVTGKIREVEGSINQFADPAARKEAESLLRALKGETEALQAAEQSARARDADLQSRLRQEQTLLDAASDRLNQIERALDQVKITP